MASADQIVVGGSGKVYVGATTETAPTTATSSLGAGWTELGYVSEDGVTFTVGKTTETVAAWQSLYPVRRIVTEASAMVKFNLRQWNTDTLKLALGGGTVTEPSSGVFKYVPPAPTTIDQRSLIVEWSDGNKDFRLYFPKGMVTEAVETNITRTSAADLPITFEATPASGDDAFILLTDDTAFDPAP